MILVTVGMHRQGFDRLVRKMDALAGAMDEEVVMQIGSSSYEPKNAEYFRFTSSRRMEDLTRRAGVLVSHAAAGAIITGLKCGTPLVVVPRLKRFGEHVDDHQFQLAEALAREGKVTAVYELDQLPGALNHATATRPAFSSARSELVTFLRGYIEGLEEESPHGE